MKWSVDGQTPLYLAMSRMATLGPATMDAIMTRIPVEPGMRILDVGCGSGEFTFRLAERVQGACFTGVDYDQGFVDCCTARTDGSDVAPLSPAPAGNEYAFLQADGMALPFDDGAFDLVVSHTYLTALPDYYAALQEMMRVCKPGGMVTSITSMGDAYDRFGTMDLLPPVLSGEDADLVDRVRSRIRQHDPSMDMRSGVPSGKVQLTFARAGLEQVATLPLSQYFSLSDAQLPAAEYHRYVDLLHAVEVESADQAMDDPDVNDLPDRDWADYRALLDRRRDQLHEMQGKNAEWSWHGSAAILVTGIVPEGALQEAGIAYADHVEFQARQEAAALSSAAFATGAVRNQTTFQSGLGRSCDVELELADGSRTLKAGFTPGQALAAAYRRALLDRPAGITGDDQGERSAFASGIGATPQTAKLEATCAALEQLVLDRLNDGQVTLPRAHDAQVYGVPGIYETVYDTISKGTMVEFFDASLGLGIPAMACKVTDGDAVRWSVASYPALGVVAQRACARALSPRDTATAPKTAPCEEGTPDWEPPYWADDPATVDDALMLLDMTFDYLGWTPSYDPSCLGDLAVDTCTLTIP